jgi:hypothetical protein
MEDNMPLNKFATWGVALIDRPRQPGLTAVTRVGLTAINATLARAAPPPPPVVQTPSVTALRIVWSLNAARDALADQDDPNVVTTNDQLRKRLESHAVVQIAAFLNTRHPELHTHYVKQFRPLEADPDDPDDLDAFDLERRERLAELTTFELLVMAKVGDPPPSSPAASAAKSRPQSRGVAAKRR